MYAIKWIYAALLVHHLCIVRSVYQCVQFRKTLCGVQRSNHTPLHWNELMFDDILLAPYIRAQDFDVHKFVSSFAGYLVP